ncbi:response regulator transcription factor [Flavobacterium petrolei]|uniref:Response regulator transcription factor n=1 Tax=Flavobacterium petrolei TaxID=2259594 RepID=A0A482TML1_9FLAO|nr:response regulator [Flavobacterium petrolei]RYJ53371.1 response regulator transcription factor [Flavobacterium petrolei]
MSLEILLVDDHIMITDCYKMALTDLEISTRITSANSLENAYKFIFDNGPDVRIDLVILDLSMPEYPEKNIENGEDLAKLIRVRHPKTKIIFITGYCNIIRLNSIIHDINPEGLIEKSDLDFSSISIICNKIIAGEIYKSERVKKTIEDFSTKEMFLDTIDRQIIILISQNTKTVNIPELLNLSLSAIEKRKAKIKIYFGVEKGSDDAIIRKAKEIGFV